MPNDQMIVFRFGVDARPRTENRLMTGIVNALGIGSLLWIGLIWTLRCLL
ncbi:MAG: hypothetical protein JO041_14355 [Acidobacteria bacterium]|nr:hypothetical protein [Acidobacteriota bacterium]